VVPWFLPSAVLRDQLSVFQISAFPFDTLPASATLPNRNECERKTNSPSLAQRPSKGESAKVDFLSLMKRNSVPAISVLLAVSTVAFFGCRNGTSGQDLVQVDRHAVVNVGMSRGQVLAALGSPTTTNTWVKPKGPIFGALEGLWADLPEGVEVDVWDYLQSKGTVSVYFMGGSNTVWHTSFVSKGVAF
jgi:hypothetical protein